MSLAEEEEKKEQDAEEDDEAGDSDEERRSTEGIGDDRRKVLERPLADLPCTGVDELTDLVETDPSGSVAVVGVTDPLRLNEDDDVDDEEAAGEDGP